MHNIYTQMLLSYLKRWHNFVSMSTDTKILLNIGKIVELRLKRIIFNWGRLKIRRIKSNADTATDVANTDWIINN